MLKFDLDNKVMRKWLIDLYQSLGNRRTIIVLNSSIDLMQSYNGNPVNSVIAEGMFENLTKKEMKALTLHMKRSEGK